ncbi:MAG: ribbon-helix-helix domain-containing protein [Candidatus Velthaea sp.]
MCQIYMSADPIQYESRSRSLRMHGVLTTIRIENLFWDVLSEMAARESLTTNQLLVKLSDEVTELRGETSNFASFLRVCCLRYLWVAGGRKIEEAPVATDSVLHAVR